MNLTEAYLITSLAIQLFQIQKLGVLPIALATAAPLLNLLLFPKSIGAGINTCLSLPAFPVYIILIVLDAFLSHFTESSISPYGIIGTFGRCVSKASFIIFIVGYTRTRPKSLAKILAWTTGLLTISSLWLIAETFVGDPFIKWRSQFYHDAYLYAAYKNHTTTTDFASGIATGLTPFLHMFGYMACGALTTLLCKLTLASSNTKNRRRNLKSWVMLALNGIALAISVQRSAIFAAAVSVFFANLTHQRQKLKSIAFAMAIIAGGSMSLIWSNLSTRISSVTLRDKLLQPDDMLFRAYLQVQGIINILRHPMGLKYEHVSWSTVGSEAAASAANVQTKATVGVHNAYIAYGLSYGWLGFALALTFLYLVWCMIRRILLPRHFPRSPHSCDLTETTVASVSFGLIFVQPMFHHASILSHEPTTVLFFAMLLACIQLSPKQVGGETPHYTGNS